MKNLFYSALFILAVVFTGCNKDEAGVFIPDIDVTSCNITFEAAEGGAIMKYTLPSSREVYTINAKYKDAHNVEVKKRASYLEKEVFLNGFNEVVENREVEVTLSDRKGNESEVIMISSFNTLPSKEATCLESIKIAPGFGGCIVSYEASVGAVATANVYYKGINQFNQKEEEILLGRFVIQSGSHKETFSIKQDMIDETAGYHVIVRVEDAKANFVGMREQEGIFPIQESTLAWDNGSGEGDFFFHDPFKKSYESEVEKMGIKYLFDGDTKGELLRQLPEVSETGGISTFFSFAAGPDIFSNKNQDSTTYFIFELKEARQISQMNIHTVLNVLDGYGQSDCFASQNIFKMGLWSPLLPCEIVVYGANPDDSFMGDWNTLAWTEVGRYKDEPGIEEENRWCPPSKIGNNSLLEGAIRDPEKLKEAEEVYAGIVFDTDAPEYRFLKIIFVDKYYDMLDMPDWSINTKNYVSVSEIELLVSM